MGLFPKKQRFWHVPGAAIALALVFLRVAVAAPDAADPLECLARELRQVHVAGETVRSEVFLHWGRRELEAHAGTPLYFDYPTATGRQTVGPQTLLLEKYLQPDELALVNKVLTVSKDPKFVERAKKADDGEGKLNPRNYAGHGVEVGAWRVTLRDGRVLAALHTSSNRGRILGKDRLAALNGLLAKNDVAFPDVVRVQYFHNHPGRLLAPLSSEDLVGLRQMRSWFLNDNPAIQVEFSAIIEREDAGRTRVLFSQTLRDPVRPLDLAELRRKSRSPGIDGEKVEFGAGRDPVCPDCYQVEKAPKAPGIYAYQPGVRGGAGDAAHLHFGDRSVALVVAKNFTWASLARRDVIRDVLTETRRVLRPDGEAYFLIDAKTPKQVDFSLLGPQAKVARELGLEVTLVQGDGVFGIRVTQAH